MWRRTELGSDSFPHILDAGVLFSFQGPFPLEEFTHVRLLTPRTSQSVSLSLTLLLTIDTQPQLSTLIAIKTSLLLLLDTPLLVNTPLTH